MPTDPPAAEKPTIETHPITPPTMRHMHGLFRNHGLTTDEAVHVYLSGLLEREVSSRKGLTEAEGRRAIADLNAMAVPDNPGGHANLASAMIAVQAALPKVPKTHTANVPMKAGGSYSYNYADLGDVGDAAMPLLGKNGLAFLCLGRLTPAGGYELVGTLLHAASGDREESALPLFGRQAQDLGSSITYARRYLLGSMTGLVTDDDEDGALAAAARERAEQQPPPYQGPPTQQLLDRLSELAIREGTTDEAMSAKWREAHGGLTFEALTGLDPWHLWPLIQSIETWMARRDAEAAAARQRELEAAQQGTPDPAPAADQQGAPA